MLEREVIFGGLDKLRDEIDGALEVIDADAYFILTGCTAGIIGDDIESVTQEYQEKGLPVYPITTPGFAGDSALGYEVAFKALLDNIVEESPQKEPKLVNLFGIIPYHDPFWSGTFEELTRILRKLGLKVNTFFTEHQGIDVVRKSSAAELNIILSPWLLQGAAKIYEEKFGVPSLRFSAVPIGATDTTKFIRQIAERLSLDEKLVDQVILQEETYVYNYLETVIGALSWKKFAVVGDAGNVIAITKYLTNDIGFTPRLAVITDNIFRDEDKKRVEDELKNMEYIAGPDLYYEADHYEIKKKIEQYGDITLLVGSSLERETAGNLGIQCHVMTFPVSDTLIINRTYSGYRGSLTLVEDLFNNL
jgi:nitrogenase molybdenum-iron protein beta chain